MGNFNLEIMDVESVGNLVAGQPTVFKITVQNHGVGRCSGFSIRALENDRQIGTNSPISVGAGDTVNAYITLTINTPGEHVLAFEAMVNGVFQWGYSNFFQFSGPVQPAEEQLREGTTVQARIPSGERWYYIEFAQNGKANFTLSPRGSSVDVDLYVYKADKSTELGRSVEGDGKEDKVSGIDVKAGERYYIKLKHYKGTGEYMLKCKNYPNQKFYSGISMKTIDRYSYNAYKILNKNPNLCPLNSSQAVRVNHIKSNLNNCISIFSGQLTQRQKSALENVKNMLISDFDDSDLDKMIEFRYEGAGAYRGGSNDDGYNSSKVSRVSIDFRNLNGNHNESTYPSDFNDGYGLFGAMSVVCLRGEVMGLFFRASTLPDEMEKDDTLKEGIYEFRVGEHPISGGYKALNLYLKGSRTLPAIIDKTSGPGIVGVNSHMGYNNERGSEGCQTITRADDDYNDYIRLFTTGDTGKFVLKRLVSLPSV